MQIANGGFLRVCAFRLVPDDDIMGGLLKACAEAKINNGIIVSAIGSLKKAVFVNPVELSNKKAKYGYGEPTIKDGPIELLNLSGMICQGKDNETLLHVHCVLSDRDGHAYGGHVLEGSKVLLTADIVVAELSDIKMGRRFDEDMDIFLFNPTEKK
jgi:predicted DNA-binding protein with PD1-like motif